MSLKGNLEFALQIKKFRNVDLFEPGFYNIRFNIYQDPNKKILAHPYTTHERPPKDPESKYMKPIIRPFIISSTSTYVTKTFSISLTDEETIFNESCYFKTEFNAFPKFENNDYYIEAELMHLDFNTFATLKDTDEKRIAAFKKIDNYNGIIKSPGLGIHEHVPIFFEFRNSCALEIVFHSAILNLRTTGTEASAQPDQKGDQKENALFLQTAKLKSLWNKKTPITLEMIDNFYIQCINPMKESYNHLLEFYASMLRLYMQETNQDISEQFLEGLPSKGEIMKYLVQGGMKTNSKGKISFFQSFEEYKISDQNLPKKISEILNFKNSELVLFAIAQELVTMNSNAYHTWRSLNELMLEVPRLVIWNLQKNYNHILRNCFHEKLVQKTYRTSDLTLSFEDNVGETHNQIAISKRANMSTKSKDIPISVLDTNLFQAQDLQPVIFEEISVKENLSGYHSNDTIFSNLERNRLRNVYDGIHLIVLCHGFQGSSFDLRLLKNTINFLYPDTLILCASSNEEETDGEISKMGIRLASEVKCYIDEWIKEINLGRLSFIGHSLGGLIIRSAFPYLEQYANKMHMFMSFSSAHLGYFSHSSKLVDVGMWLMRQWKGSKCLRELSLADAENLEDTYLYKLSKKKGLNWFKHIVLLSSYQDHYAPFQSARIQLSKKGFPDPEKQPLYEQMAANILSDISADCIYRIDTNFSIQETTLDSMLGRVAHIQFLESHYLIKMLVWRYANFFS